MWFGVNCLEASGKEQFFFPGKGVTKGIVSIKAPDTGEGFGATAKVFDHLLASPRPPYKYHPHFSRVYHHPKGSPAIFKWVIDFRGLHILHKLPTDLCFAN